MRYKNNKPFRESLSEVYVTGKYVPLCACTTPPWEHCEHTIDMEEKRLINELKKITA